jgi:hypothetical protein
MNDVAYSLDELSAALRFQMQSYDPSSLKLPAAANALADVYGLMLAKKWTSIPVSMLSDVQIRYVNEALAGQLTLDP